MAFLIRSLREVRLLLIATYRSDELHRRHPLRPLLTGWGRVRIVNRIELDRFRRDEVAAQLAAILAAEPGSGLTDLIFDRSDGNAYLVEELIGVVRRGGSSGGASGPEQPGTGADASLEEVAAPIGSEAARPS